MIAREHEARRRDLEHEIALRKRVEQALREAEEYLRLMVESVKDFAIFTVDPASTDRELESRRRTTLSASPSQRFWGSRSTFYSRRKIEPAAFPSAKSPRPPPRACASDERWHQCKDGGRFFASGVVTPIFDEENKLRGFTKIARHHRAKASRGSCPRGGRAAQGDRRDRCGWHHHD